MPDPKDDRLQLFVSYAPEDQALKDYLLAHLAILRRFGKIDPWSADQVGAGEDWRRRISEAVERAHLAILLISAPFLASDWIQDGEAQQLFERRSVDGLRVIPILLRSCRWQSHPWLTKLHVLPKGARAIASFKGDRRDQVAADVVEEIERLVQGHLAVVQPITRTEPCSSPLRSDELIRRYAAGERNFVHQQLRGANLVGAALSGANFSGADLSRADLNHADLSGANLSNTDLTEARLASANLCDADMTSANLSRADLGGATINGALFGGARIAGTMLWALDLAPLCDAFPPVEHLEPSPVDHQAIIKSIHSPDLKVFLRLSGMPEVFIEYMIDCARTLDPLGVFKLLQSTFISYGGPDEVFARRLYEALHKNGVTTFFFPEHAVPGKKLGRMMRQGVNDFDRIVLVCSKNSLDRTGVMAEIEHSLSREDRERSTALIIPVVLDDYVFSGWSPPHSDVLLTLKDRVAADFRGWDTDAAKFDQGLRKLIMALKK